MITGLVDVVDGEGGGFVFTVADVINVIFGAA